MGVFILWYDPEKLGFCNWYCINLCSLSLQMSSHRFARSGSQSSSMELRCTISRESRDLSACHHKEAPPSVRLYFDLHSELYGNFFWTSSDVSSVFQSQSEQPYSYLAEAYMLHVLWESPLVQHLLISWWPAWQPRHSFPHIPVSRCFFLGGGGAQNQGLLCCCSQCETRQAGALLTKRCRLTQELSTSMSNHDFRTEPICRTRSSRIFWRWLPRCGNTSARLTYTPVLNAAIWTSQDSQMCSLISAMLVHNPVTHPFFSFHLLSRLKAQVLR